MTVPHAFFMRNFICFYLEGFRNMRLGRALWKIILLKLLFIFLVLKLFFFPDVLKLHYDNDADRAEHVLRRLTQINGTVDNTKLLPTAK